MSNDTLPPLTDEDFAGIDDEKAKEFGRDIYRNTGVRELAIMFPAKVLSLRRHENGSAWGFRDVMKCALDHHVAPDAVVAADKTLLEALDLAFNNGTHMPKNMAQEWDQVAIERKHDEIVTALANEYDDEFASFFGRHLHWFDDQTDEKRTRARCVEFIRNADSDECLDIDDVAAALKQHVRLPGVIVDSAREEHAQQVHDEARRELLRNISSRYERHQFLQFALGATTLRFAARCNDSAPPALWGAGLDVLWSESESLIIEASFGVGKTTLAGKLVLARLFGGNVLGYPVQQLGDGETILYLALDRPQQIIRSMLRQFTSEQIDALDKRLIIHQGPIPADAAEHDRLLVDLADYYEATDIFVDSVKDAALGLSEDRAAAIYQRGRQNLLRSGRQLVELHHLSKGGDAYGSVWLNAGVGSVVRLTGEPGGPTATLKQMKSPAHRVDPIKIVHDRDNGEMLVAPTASSGAPTPSVPGLPNWIAQHGPGGVTAAQVSRWLYGNDSEAAVKRAKRTLLALSADGGPLVYREGGRSGDGRQQPSRWTVRGQE